MKRYEYRSEPLQFVIGKSNRDQIMDALNRYGREGWRLNRLDSGFPFGMPSFSWKGGVMLLLEREIVEES